MPYPVKLELDAANVHAPKLEVQEIACSGTWAAPELTVEKLSAKLYGGNVDADAHLNVGTRELGFNVTSDFDGKKITPLLTPMAREWLANYSWNNPPHIKANGAMILPASVWTNRDPDWRGELRPTLRLDGQFRVLDGAFRGVRASTAESHFSYSNMCWRLPDLIATRRDGYVTIFHESDERTKDFYFRVHSTLDPSAARPLLETNQLRLYEFFSLTQPPIIDAEIRGKWHNPEVINAKAHVALTNFVVRGAAGDSFQSNLEYTNRILTLIQPRVQLAVTQQLTADIVKLVFDERRIYVTNGFSTAVPTMVVHAIGPHAESAVEPYHFLYPPTVHVEGAIPMRDPDDADLHFDVDGGEFTWWKFRRAAHHRKNRLGGQTSGVAGCEVGFLFWKSRRQRRVCIPDEPHRGL